MNPRTRLFAAALATTLAAPFALLVSLAPPALASHVGTVTLTPPVAISDLGVCSPFVVSTSGGTDPIGAIVDVEIRGSSPVRFCLPTAGTNPVLIDPATGDLGPGPIELDGTIGGEAAANAGAVPTHGQFTFGMKSNFSGSFDITAFVEEPGSNNDDPDANEPQDTASQFFVLGGGTGSGTEVPGATQQVTALDCQPESDINPSGSRQDFFCRGTGAGGTPIAGAQVSFDVTAGPNSEEVGTRHCGFTDNNGIALCHYRDSTGSNSPAGTDTIVGFTGSSLAATLNQDTITSTFAGSGSGATTKIRSRVSIRKKFRGKVRSTVTTCRSGRKVAIKKVRKGRDKTIGHTRTHRAGTYRIRRSHAKGRFYTIAKRKRVSSGGSSLLCKAARSKIVRRH